MDTRSMVLLLMPGAVQLSQLRLCFFNFPSTPIWLLFVLNLRPIQVNVCRSVPFHSTLKAFEAKVRLSSCFRSDTAGNKSSRKLSAPFRNSSQPGSDPGLSCGLRGADKSELMGYIYCSPACGTCWMSLNTHVGHSHPGSTNQDTHLETSNSWTPGNELPHPVADDLLVVHVSNK